MFGWFTSIRLIVHNRKSGHRFLQTCKQHIQAFNLTCSRNNGILIGTCDLSGIGKRIHQVFGHNGGVVTTPRVHILANLQGYRFVGTVQSKVWGKISILARLLFQPGSKPVSRWIPNAQKIPPG